MTKIFVDKYGKKFQVTFSLHLRNMYPKETKNIIKKYERIYKYGDNYELLIKNKWNHRKLQRLIPNKPPEIIKRKKI